MRREMEAESVPGPVTDNLCGAEELPLPPRVTPTFGDRPKDAYWAAAAERTWKQVRTDFLPRMQAGERTIQAMMREPMTTEIAMLWIDRMPEVEDVDYVIFDYDEFQPDKERYWAVEARGDNQQWLMEIGEVAREHSSPRQLVQPIREDQP